MTLKEPHRATQRVIDILENIAYNRKEGLSLAEISTQLEAPKSSLFPIVHTLCENNFIQINNQTGKYTMGFKTYELGNTFLCDDYVNASILDIMHNISDQCRETCYFGELEDGDVYYLFKVDSPESLRMVNAGKKLPAYSCGIGKALLSDKSFDDLKKLYPENLEPLTENTIKNINILYEQLKQIRSQDIAFEKEESTKYIQCIAIPIRKNGKVRAAMSVATPVFRYTPEKETMIIGLLKQAQLKIEPLIASNNWSHF